MMARQSTPEVIDRYTIDRKLSEGGMAEVFLAHQSVAGYDQRVVVKSLLPDFIDDRDFVKMMLNEAHIAAGLCHPNIVQVVDLVDVGGRPFIVMEFLDGQNLRQILNATVKLQRRLTAAFASHVIANVLAGLAHAHDQVDEHGRSLGLVHRDVSLANVIVTWQGGVKLIDFGIAKATSMVDQELTRAGQLKGKSSYMSPEQVRREPLDRRSDVFSVGIVLWEMLTRRRLFSRKSELESMIAICNEDVAAPSSIVPGLPQELDAICKKALAHDREERYQTADEMRADVEALIAAQGWTNSPLALQEELAALFPDESPAAAQMVTEEELDEEMIVVEEWDDAPLTVEDRAEPSASAPRPSRSMEMILFNQPTPGPSVYDDMLPDGSTSVTMGGPSWASMLLLVLLCLFLGAAGTALVQHFQPHALARMGLGSVASAPVQGGAR
jgi:serine/threonine-protein kinase